MDSKTLINNIQQWLRLRSKAADEGKEPPRIPAEIFSTNQMERYGITLALSHELTQKVSSSILLNRLSKSEDIIIDACKTLSEKTNENDSFSPAREWLLDNFYLIQEQVHSIRRHLPKGYGRSLPKLMGALQGYPRIYDIALEIIEHGDGHWDIENLSRFFEAYQEVTHLTLGELWATPIALGVALIENLSRTSLQIVSDRNARNLADHWADRMIEVAVIDPKQLVIVIADMARSEPKMSSAFVAELARRLQGATLALPLSWIEQHLTGEGSNIEQLVDADNKRQAAIQITVSNSITSLRNLSEIDWRRFVEAMSIVEKTLRQDPAAIYSKMDFGTRDRYRHVIERLSRASSQTEEKVAATTIELATIADPESARQRHIGFYLIGRGFFELEKVLGIRRTLWQKCCHLARRRALRSYLGCILAITGGLTISLLLKASYGGLNGLWLWVLGAIITICTSQLALELVNLAATLLIQPKPLPRMDFSSGIPTSCRTIVVVPTMLGSIAGIETLVEALEVRYLGNRDNHLHFALLTDFNDAPEEHMPEDVELLATAAARINALNEQYPQKHIDTFFLFHRARQWNASEQVWMGKERKRGKLEDLNNLLCNNIQTGFSLIVGCADKLKPIKYVITLDSDTQLPRDSAKQFIGTMAHPLNQPRLDPEKLKIVEGYGILQPRIAEALPNNGPTRYVKLCGSEFGIDPYTRTVSDVYQDVFYEGSFVGKGIYDIAVFQQVLGQRLPDNCILSHDLLEGCYLRSGFLSDVPLYEKSPSSYLADAKRRIRWIRGDWQLVGWLRPTVSNQSGRRVPNPLSALSIFKIFDNLRRSLVPIAFMVLLGLNWTLLPTTDFWLAIILAIVVLPGVINTLLELVRKPNDMHPSQHMNHMIYVIRRRTLQLLLYLACLPHEAWYSLMAILQTLWRILVSHRHFLEWTPSDQVDRCLRNTATEWMTNLWMGPAAAFVAIVILVSNSRFMSLLFAAPLIILWLISPVITRWLSQPISQAEPKLTFEQIRFLHKVARKTWGFFDTFVTSADNWLPPDNYQEAPIEILARRTSPTNIGLALLANLTAYDFGYITIDELLDRIKNTLETIKKLERYHGHLYNWYSTETLKPLFPRYISTVDSGNLAGHLLTLRQGLLALQHVPLLNRSYLEGLEDTFDVLAATMTSLPPVFSQFFKILKLSRVSFADWSPALTACDELCKAANQIIALSASADGISLDTAEWSKKLLKQCLTLQAEIQLFASIPNLSAQATLREISILGSNKTSDIATKRLALIEMLAELASSLAQMDVSFLIDEASHLMTIGFNIEDQRRDPSRYDLLSSEARLASFVAIAQGRLPQENWFALGRLLVSNGGEPTLISWSGSMFEYLMPLLVMPTYPGTLLDQTNHAAVNQQIAYGKQRGIPWGVSESGFNAVDTQFNYLYRAFGVPGLGLKRGLEDDVVIAPYASAMALMVAPEAACINLQQMAAEEVLGQYGFYEAIDFTAARLPRDSKKEIVRSFMAHHQGMSLLAISYLLHNQPMQKRFVVDPEFQATLLLLQERIPKPSMSYLQMPKSLYDNTVADRPQASMRVFNTPNTRTPQVQLLSNGRYHLMLTQAGGGYSRWKEFAVTRWREDSTSDNWGLFGYIRDSATGEFCSTNYQPTQVLNKNFKSVFSAALAEFSCTALGLDLHTEVVVSPEDDIELRRLRIHNRSKIRRVIEFTSYGEVVLAPQAADLAQPAFNNLFIETEILSDHRAIIATRRPQDSAQNPPWLCHLLNVNSEQPYTMSFETDRSRFIGRGFTLAKPRVLVEPGDLSNTSGAVLDPIVAIRCRLILKPDSLVTFDLLTGVTESREQCVALIDKYQDRHLADRIFGVAWTHGQVLLHQLNISEADAQLYERLASAIIYTSNTRRGDPDILATNKHGQSGLWGYSISGDLPIVLVQIEHAANIELVQHLIRAQTYWRRKGLMVDLIILNQERISYRQTLQDLIMSLITTTSTADHTGSIVVRIAEQVPLEDNILFQSVARVILSDKRGTLKEQLGRRRVSPPPIPLLDIEFSKDNYVPHSLATQPQALQFFNGLGGFSPTGNEYIIHLTENMPTPAPWVNVLANPNFGTIVSESGQGYTWSENAHEFRLTPWDNDPLQDSAGEAFYLRDDETGSIWSPTALPCRGRGDYLIRHGFGYSVFEHSENEIHTELWITVALDAPVKFALLKIRNDSKHERRLSVTGYVEWVLGDLRTKNAMHIVTELSHSGALLAQNHYNSEFSERTAFFDVATSHLDLKKRTVTGDRAEFIGRNRTQQNPAALERAHLSDRVGAGFDPCGAIQLTFELANGQSREIVFTLGCGKDRQEADTLAQRYNGGFVASTALTSVQQYWQQMVSKLQVTTPDPALNLLTNGWLLYQLLSSRLWGRSGYYQSGGAFGFRDQLQDVMALTQSAPELFRAHLLLCASHQFELGDVQHWWHPPQNRGVRTRCSDDYLWLPYALCQYVEVTGDMDVLNETVPFLQGRMLNADEESYYDLPTMGSTSATLYQHAVRAIQHGLKFGEHGLPLMGSGDWNDGMNMVGIKGKGESVWLGFFLYAVLKRFALLAANFNDTEFADLCHVEKDKLQRQIEANAWDGEWYRRAYFDDGTPLGSARNSECRIDSIAQSWSVLSGAAELSRARQAMESLQRHLVNSKDNLVKLLDPPFDKSIPNPGYIEGYLPGIRENGGQYTHAGVWAAMAFAKLGEKTQAWQLLHILNPINHGRSTTDIQRYMIEPYVVAGDIYSVSPHVGRGGWSWYTGSAGWLYRLITETLLGIQLIAGKQLRLVPILPDNWSTITVDYRYGNTLYQITVNHTKDNTGIWLDGIALNDNVISLQDDGHIHHIVCLIS